MRLLQIKIYDLSLLVVNIRNEQEVTLCQLKAYRISQLSLKTVKMGYITEQGLQELKKYEYKAGGMTWFDSKINYFWEWIVTLMPKTIAPNLMTFIGWCFILASYGNMLRYDLTFDKDIPSWCFFFACFCIFTFVTLDAIDGKQARRTKGGSPLGQLFDHGCDSYTMSFLMLGLCEALQIDKTAVFTLFIITQLAFWTANWTENHTGVLNTNVGQFGVTEGQHLCMLVHILTGIFGQKMWQVTPLKMLPTSFRGYKYSHPWIFNIFNLTLGTSLVYLSSAIILVLTAYMFIGTLGKAKDSFKAASQYLSSILLVIMEILWSTTLLYEEYSGLILVHFGFLASLILCKLIICTVTKMEVTRFHFELVPCMIATVVLLFLDVTNAGVFSMKVAFWVIFVIDVVWVFAFLSMSIKQISDFLRIHCFSLEKKGSLKKKASQQQEALHKKSSKDK